jgi:hypothetical protein
MERNRFSNVARLLFTTILVAQLLAGCASVSQERSLIRSAREFAKNNGVEAEKYSGTLLDRPDEYFILFTRRRWPHAVGDNFGVHVNKQTGKYRLTYGL